MTRPRGPARTLRGDERGSFIVLEAILVALLVLTAILFFTSVQRPSTGSDQGGIDLSQVAADTLSILEVRTFSSQAFDTWATKLSQGDSATSCIASAPTAATCPTAVAVDSFLREVLPTGTRYSLLLDNGVSTLPLLPLGSTPDPHGARAAQVLFLPRWGAFAAQTAVLDGAAPNEAMTTAAHPVLSRFTDPADIRCIKAPNGSSLAGTTGSLGPGAINWTSRWQVTATTLAGSRTITSPIVTFSAPVNTSSLEAGMHVAGTGIPAGATILSIDSATQFTLSTIATSSSNSALTFTHNRVPAGALYGTWAGYTDASCSTGVVYAKVWAPRFRTVTDGQTTIGLPTLTSPTAAFTSLDLGLPVSGPGIPDGTRITGIDPTGTIATLSASATATASGLTIQLPSYSPYPPYGLQLVVWFGA